MQINQVMTSYTLSNFDQIWGRRVSQLVFDSLDYGSTMILLNILYNTGLSFVTMGTNWVLDLPPQGVKFWS